MGVVFADLNEDAATKAAEESKSLAINANYRAIAVCVNVSDESSVRAMVETTVKEFGRIDYSVNSAGVWHTLHTCKRHSDELNHLVLTSLFR